MASVQLLHSSVTTRDATTRDVATGDVATDVATDDVTTKDEKELLLSKVPHHITNVDQAVKYYISHATMRWEESGKMTAVPEPVT